MTSSRNTPSAPIEMRARAAEWTPERAAAITGIDVETIVSLGQRYGRAKAAFIRVNYGLQRHYGGGMAVRTIACLPAVDRSLAARRRRRAAEFERELRVRQGGARTARTLAAGAHDQHDPPGRSAHAPRRGRGRPAGEGARRVQLESGRRRARPQRGAARARARGPVHRRARAFPDRHRGLGGHCAARDDAARALGCASLVRASLCDAEPAGDRAHRREQAEQRDLPAHGREARHHARRDARRRRHAHPAGARERQGQAEGRHLREAAREGVGAAERAQAVSAFRRRRSSSRRAASASSSPSAWWNWDSTRCPISRRRASSPRRCRSWPSGSR